MTSSSFRQNGSLRRTSRPTAVLAMVVAAGAITLLGSLASAKQVTVKVSEAPIKAGDKIIGTAKYGERFEVLETQAGFYQVEFLTPQNQRRKGWLWREHVNGSVDDESNGERSAPASEPEPSQLLATIFNLRWQGRFREAISLTERLVKFYEKSGAKATPRAADAYYLHARLYGELREHDKAFALYDRALQASLDANGIRSYRTAACAVGLAEAAYGRGQIGLMRHGLRLAEQQRNQMRQREESENRRQSMGGNPLALVMYDASTQAITIMMRDQPSDLRMLYQSSESIAQQITASRMPADEADKLKRLIAPERYDSQQLEDAEFLTDWALLMMRLGHLQRAEPLASRGLDLRKEQSGPRTPVVADSLHVLGQIKFAAKDYAGCRRQCLEALKIVGGFEAGTIPSAVVLRTLMQTAFRANDLNEAARCGCQALRVYEDKVGNDHADTVACRGELATIRFAQKKSADALRLYDVAARSHFQSASTYWTFANDALADQGPHGNGGLACAVSQRGSPEAARVSAEWLINFKGLLTDRRARQLALNGQVARGVMSRVPQSISGEDSQDNAAIQKYTAQMYAFVLPQFERSALLNRIFVQRHGILRYATPEAFSALQRSEQKMTEIMAQWCESPPSTQHDEPWVRLDELQKRLPADTWLLECARYISHAASADEERASYAAWVIPPLGRGGVEIVPLGAAGDLDRLISVARRMLRAAGNTAKNEAAEERAWQETATKLAKESLLPVWNRLPAGCHRLLIAPDGALWDIPWGALPVSSNKYAIEQRAIDYLISERSLVHSMAPTATPSTAVVFADPDFDADVETIQRNAERQQRLPTYNLASFGISDGLPKVPRLPGTRQEAEAIVPSLKQMTGDDPILHTGGEANATFFSTLKSPKILVMSTHGFYLKSRCYSQSFTTTDRPGNFAPAAADVDMKKPEDFRDPLDRCGLLLAGCNQRPTNAYERFLKRGDYGVLTGQTVSATDLSATELVVLSACDTSLGQSAANGEVESLRQAFHIAGARQVVATLWSIPDAETVQLMKAFFERLAKHQSHGTALREAQLDVISQRRKDHGAAHPLYWAAFEMSLRQLEATQPAD
jgi:CHAT domain-containing protein